MSNQSFKDLQREWYAKLADSGFVDIELSPYPGKWPVQITDDTDLRMVLENDLRFDYFNGVKRAVYELYGSLHHRLLTHRQRIMLYVLERHADGASTRRICAELSSSGLSPNRRNTINAWIKQFVYAAGIRYYSPEEMRNL